MENSSNLGHHNRKYTNDSFDVVDKGFNTPCWISHRSTDEKGYPFFWDAETKRMKRQHRHVYQTAYGSLPDWIDVHHLCSQESCIRLDHLQAVTKPGHGKAHRRINADTEASIIQALQDTRRRQADIAKEFGIGQNTVSKIWHRHSSTDRDAWNSRRASHAEWSPTYSECQECGTQQRPHKARGYCAACYKRLRLAGKFRS